jgi:predicted RNA-binding protein YlqC (UPF0109 family)
MAASLAEFLIKNIVSNPDVISVTEAERHGKRILQVQVSQKDMARVMGSRGLVIRAIRTLITSTPHNIEDVVVEALPD